MDRGAGRRTGLVVAVAAVVIAVGGGVSFAGGGGKGPVGNPDEALTFEERDQKYRDSWETFERRYGEWLASPHAAVDPRTLPRSEKMALQVAGAETFTEAVDRAALAVSGRVISVRFEPNRTITEFQVDRHALGKVGEVLTFVQSGGLYPDRDFVGAHLVELTGNPILLEGDRMVLLLDRATDGALYIQSVSGQYLIRNGKTTSVALNRFRDADGITADQLMDHIETH